MPSKNTLKNAIRTAIAKQFHFTTQMLRALKKELKWGERRGSNPRQPESQSGALPTELRSP